ncbi:MAG TPA: hypothetical protein VMH28_06400 [Candidatus Acidoferrales bacterium]|nr:hypothetical protein [Candidatus Acidoferrales bacterium]
MEETRLHGPHDGPGHETTDINVWAVGKFAFALVGVTVLSLALLFGLMKYFQSRETTEVVQTVDPAAVFPQPQLQKTPIPDLRQFHAEEDKILGSYGWVDQPKGVVRIPIDRAIDVLAQRGLPSRQGGAK